MMLDIEIVGNALCFDFANTVSARPSARWDVLATAETAAAWAAAIGHPITDSIRDEELDGAQELREVVYRVFHHVAHGGQPASDDLDALTAEYAAGVQAASLRAGDGTYRLSWPGDRTLRTLRWEVATSAVDLLTAGPLDRVGECPACGWLFLDTSKNRSRRWCSMATCGGRDKARRYYARHTTR